tara:strand:+ start:383 stop:874 length:492 start_codon:yes stop_codon:yes gene_type:complete
MSIEMVYDQMLPSCVNCIQSERNYQEKMWNKDTTDSAGFHSESEFIVFMQDYLREAMNTVSRNPEPQASQMASHTVRKICAMALACAEKNEWLEKFCEFMKYNKANGDINLVKALALMQSCLNKAFDAVYDGSETALQLQITLCFMADTQAMTNMELYPMRDK